MGWLQRRASAADLSGLPSCILLMSMDQPSSIPVDRHVFQFAERWYRIKTKGGLKGYEFIADKFRALWGPYAGWAHSVLFTADLRAFATYKQEEEVKVKVKPEDDLKGEIVEEPLLFRDNGRPARPIKRASSTLTDTYPAVKPAPTRTHSSKKPKQ